MESTRLGLIFDTSVVIAAERGNLTTPELLDKLSPKYGDRIRLGLSVIGMAELLHGVYRSRSEAQKLRRTAFLEQIFFDLPIYPLTADIARVVGRIEGEQAAVGNVLPFPDLAIGATALYLGFSVLTLNARHFGRIPGLDVRDGSFLREA